MIAVVTALVAAPAGGVVATAPTASPAAARSGPGPDLTGTLTDLLTSLLTALLGGQTPPPVPPSTGGGTAQAPLPMVVDAAREKRVVKLVNKRRAAAGCPRVRSNASLRQAARTHSVGMAQYRSMTHFLPGEAGLGQRISYAGYAGWQRVAENIASGYVGPRGVMRAWMASPGHRRNILDCRFREIGVGVVVQGPHVWWTQDFGRR